VSTAAAIEAIRQAKARGLPVTCDTAPPYFVLNETAIGDYRTFAKLSPPLRNEWDRRAVIEGLRDGTIDAIASDHAPWDQDSKRLPFSSAAYGMQALSLKLYHNRHLGLLGVVRLLTLNPAQILRMPVGRLAVGAPADLVLFDPDLDWQICPDDFLSKSKNAPFDDRPVRGRVQLTMVDGRAIFRRAG
jgi:dihydroorotase